VLNLETLIPNLIPIQLLNGNGGRLGIVIAHKAKPSTPAGILLHHNAHREQGPIRREQIVHIQIGELIGDVKDEQVRSFRTLVRTGHLNGWTWVVHYMMYALLLLLLHRSDSIHWTHCRVMMMIVVLQ